MSWQGRTIVVTGSTQGIGEESALLFAREGGHVIVHGLEPVQGEDVVGRCRSVGGKADFIHADLSTPESAARVVEFAVEKTGRLDVLVNNAGANVFAGTRDATVDTWQKCIDLDLRAVWLCSQAAATAMESPGAIVNVASNHAMRTLPGAFPYNVAKAGVISLTQSLAIELADQGVRVNAVCPGYIDTSANIAYFNTFDDPAGERERVEALHPLGRIGQPLDIAMAIRFLASNQESGFTTGTSLTVDGGRSALLQDP